MSMKKAERKAWARERWITEKMRNNSAFIRCPNCNAYVRRDAQICWKCGYKLCEI
uniref:Putative zinc-ribbon domain-containing protein n=1 Tax=viral metagenome TaxID=1070528 RepID=A0A6H2A517_9ZZZZ